MKAQPVFRDERTISIENASYRLGYMVISFGLLLIVAWRSFFFQESNWDLMALVIIGGMVTTAYQAFQRTINRRWLLIALIIAGVAALTAVGIIIFHI